MSPRLLAACAALSWGAALAAQQAGVARPAPAAATQAAQQPVDYQQDIKPLLEAKCGECHNGIKRKGGLSLATYADILDGGKDGAVVRPGNSAGSLLIQRLTGPGRRAQMPKDEPPLSRQRDRLDRALDRSRARARRLRRRRRRRRGMRRSRSTPPAVPPRSGPAGHRPSIASSPRTCAATAGRQTRRWSPTRCSPAARISTSGDCCRRPTSCTAFLGRSAPDKRDALVTRLLADDDRYADHWISFWNDLLRNEDGVTYYSEQNGRRSITPWLLSALSDQPALRPLRRRR